MSQFKKLAMAGAIAASMMGATSAQAHHAYNPNGYDGVTAGYSLGGADGGNPGSVNNAGGSTWSGPGANYTGSMVAMWYTKFHYDTPALETHNLSTAEALTKTWDHDANSGTAKVLLPANFELAVGAKSWEDTAGQGADKGWGHKLDFGLINLDKDTSSLSITVAADNSQLLPGFTLYRGWDTSTDSDRHGSAYENNANNPLGTVNLALVAAIDNTGTSSLTYTFHDLLAGNYTLAIGGDDGANGGRYTVSMTGAPVPVPGAVWLFGSAIAGLVGFGRRKTAIAA